MRFKLVLERVSSGRFMPLNYQYAVSSWIYKKIQEADPYYSRFLHRGGYEIQNRQYKLFTFSQIESYPFKISQDRMELKGSAAAITFSFMADTAAEYFIKGIFQDQAMPVKDPVGGVVFHISRIETLPYPEFKEEMEYQLVTPACVSYRGPADCQPRYLAPDHPQYADLLINNLLRKYSALQTVEAGGLDPINEENYNIDFRLLSDYRQKLTTIKPYTDQETKVKGYMYKFSLKAPVAMQEAGYYSGFGEKNSMGFGYCEAN